MMATSGNQAQQTQQKTGTETNKEMASEVLKNNSQEHPTNQILTTVPQMEEDTNEKLRVQRWIAGMPLLP